MATPLSPRTWGWTVRRVNPAKLRGGCPHARGGGPGSTIAQASTVVLSPRAWGWTEVTSYAFDAADLLTAVTQGARTQSSTYWGGALSA